MTNRATGWVAPKGQYAVPVMFNPYTGEPRDVRDVQSDPQGILIVPPGKVEMLATSPAQAAESVLEDAARYRWLREGNDVKHGAAWHVAVNLYGYEWDAAIDAARKQGGKQ